MKKINQIIRQNIFDISKILNISWQGNLNDIDFLERIFDLTDLPSYDSRHKNATEDIIRHRITNPDDWSSDWVFTDERFNLSNCADEVFLKFICLSLHPVVRDDQAQISSLFKEFNRLLKNSGYELFQSDILSDKPVFSFRKINYNPEIRVYVSSTYSKQPPNLPDSAFYPCIYLISDSWDDFGWKTMFNVFYFRNKIEVIEVGYVKILQKDTTTTIIKNDLDQLPDDYISIGSSIKYYEEIIKLPVEEYEVILRTLNDSIFKGEKFSKNFFNDQGWKTSIMRFSETEKAFNEAGKLFRIKYKNFEERTKFLFTTRVIGFDSDHEILFNFEKNKIPFRSNVLIGKNGTGKTSLLANMANALSGQLNDKNSFGYFEPRPFFSKIIAISYSIFDKFEIPKVNNGAFSYLFLGIRISETKDEEEDGKFISRSEMKEKFLLAVSFIEKNGRVETWRKVIGNLLSIDDFNSREYEDIFNKTSSGEAILLNIFTNVIAYIKEQSLLLIDEPEVHLHPNAISNFTKTLNEILDEFDSYAIISTHSPIVVQEIPSKYIHILRREGGEPIVNDLNIESFGENLSVVTNEIFETDFSESNYKSVLQELSKIYSYEEIMLLFSNGLSFNAKLYLQSLFDLKNKSDEKSSNS